jgi:hypothetical protein
MRRGHVGRREGRGRRRANGLGCGRRRHHLGLQAMHVAHLLRVSLITTPRVRIAVYPRVTSQLVGPRELLAAPRKLASMRLLSRVCPDVPSLVLQSVECLIAERALVGTGQLVVGLGGLSSWERPVRAKHANGSHVGVGALLSA